MSDLEQRVKELETKVKILEETLETLKNMQLSEEMEGYIQSKTKSLKLINLMNAVSEQPELDFNKEETSVQNIRAAKNTIDEQIKAALRNTIDFSEEYPDDPRYFDYEVEFGIIRDRKDDNLSKYAGKGIRITSYNGFDTERVIVPAEINGQPVVSIGEKVFQNGGFSEIILPSSLKIILDQAFVRCKNLKSIDLPKSVKYLGKYCFSETGLEEICIPNTVEIIPDGCFFSCKNLKNIILGNRTIVLGRSAFKGCLQLSRISLPETIEEIQYHCFADTQIELLIIPSTVKEVPGNIFYDVHGCKKMSTITCVFLGKETEILGGFSRVKQIYCLPGSNAQKNAREHSVPMKPLSEFNLDKI